jgi:adenylate cyclase
MRRTLQQRLPVAAGLVTTLDQYFEGVAGIVIEHGGMIDKIIGDGVHALFNAPLDLEDHPQRAVECAIAFKPGARSFVGAPLPQQSSLVARA